MRGEQFFAEYSAQTTEATLKIVMEKPLGFRTQAGVTLDQVWGKPQQLCFGGYQWSQQQQWIRRPKIRKHLRPSRVLSQRQSKVQD